METVADYFGSLVFNDAVMREKLVRNKFALTLLLKLSCKSFSAES